ncbi:MAG: 2-C-methyl-D-erythritol 4-phosphate cytidylyltransferase [Oscillospiraceae bacterium]
MCSEMILADTAVLLVCAGNATRMGGIHKILHPLGDTTVLEKSLHTFSQCKAVSEVVVICRPQDEAAFQAILQQMSIAVPITVAYGGATRQQSVTNGVAALQTDAAYIAIHDGARPLLRVEDAEKVIADAHTFGAATLGVPVKDTIKTVAEGVIVDTPPRSSLYHTQTPQVFARAAYLQAMAFAQAQGLDFTDDCQLMEAIHIPVMMTTGSYTNIKLTTPEDFATAEALLRYEQEREGSHNG